MAGPTSTRGRFFGLKLGDGAGSEVFTKTCLVNSSIGIQLAKALGETVAKDCSDDDVVPWVIKDATSKSASLSGEGVLDTASISGMMTWYNGVETKNIELEMYASNSDGSVGSLFGTFTGAFHLTQFDITAPDEGRATASISLESSGAITWTAE